MSVRCGGDDFERAISLSPSRFTLGSTAIHLLPAHHATATKQAEIPRRRAHCRSSVPLLRWAGIIATPKRRSRRLLALEPLTLMLDDAYERWHAAAEAPRE